MSTPNNQLRQQIKTLEKEDTKVFDTWKTANFNKYGSLLQAPGSKYSVKSIWKHYLNVLGCPTPETLWTAKDRDTIITEIRVANTPMISISFDEADLSKDNISETVKKHLTKNMLNRYEWAKMSPDEREIYEAIDEAYKKNSDKVDKEVIKALTSELAMQLRALESICEYLGTRPSLDATKLMAIHDFLDERLNDLKPWDEIGMDKDEWLNDFLVLARVKAPSKKSSREEKEITKPY